MIGSSILLGAVFVAIGYLVSALVGQRGTAAREHEREPVVDGDDREREQPGPGKAR